MQPFLRLTKLWLQFRKSLTPERLLVSSFALLISFGTLFLSSSWSTIGEALSFVDALFTATSAVCVTGLIVVDTGTKLSLSGQIGTLVMIQLGGIGIMTFSTAFVYMIEGRLSIVGRDVLQESLSQGPTKNLKSLVKTVFLATFLIEAAGAAVLTIRFLQDMPLGSAVYSAVFHAVSAFCNAGFSLYSDSFIPYQGDLIVNLTVSSLIVCGGLGFVVIYEVHCARFRNWQKLSLHSRLVFVTSAILIGIGALLFLLLESGQAMAGAPLENKLLAAIFQSISARTAGFNTVDIASLAPPALFVIMVLMFIGASPASCGGGIKTTTFAILLSMTKSRFRGAEETNLFLRRIPAKTVSKAITVAFFASLSIVGCTFLLLVTEADLTPVHKMDDHFLQILFEATSAFATVGLSTGITAALSDTGRLLIVVLMFLGRLGPLTLALAVGRRKQPSFKFAEENVMTG